MTRPSTVRADDMLERVARAMCGDRDARLIAGQLHAPSFDESGPDVQRYWLAIARAAFGAMRSEITDQMIVAGQFHFAVGGDEIIADWQAMIDSALATDMLPGGGR